MDFENDLPQRGSTPPIELVAWVEYKDKSYLGWVERDALFKNGIVRLLESFEVVSKPIDMAPYRAATIVEEGLRGEVWVILPNHDIPSIRLFSSYDQIQVFGIGTAILRLYLNALENFHHMKVVIKPQLFRKEKPTNGTR